MTVLAAPTPTMLAAPTPTLEAPSAADARVHCPRGASSPTEDLLRARGGLPFGDPERAVLRDRAIRDNLPLANRLAHRYTGRGEGIDDLRQVAALALIRAVDGYEPHRSTPFISYAIPTIVGALKRHFRDTAWGMRVPRSTQELLLDLATASSSLTQLLGRPPTSVELAGHLRISVDVLVAAIAAAHVYRLPSLNEPAIGHSTAERIDLLGAVDPHYTSIDDHLTLSSLLAALPDRERRILVLRYCDEMTQERIAVEIGISQMHVSRLLRQSLAQLRAGLLASASP